MRPLAPVVLAGLTAAAAAAAGLELREQILARRDLLGPGAVPIGLAALADELPSWAHTALAGRVLLGWLPAGRLGARALGDGLAPHALAELALSLALGSALLAALSSAWSLLGLAPPPPLVAWLALGPPALLLALRERAPLPGREPRLEEREPLARTAGLGLLVLASVPFLLVAARPAAGAGPEPFRAAALSAASLALVPLALRSAGRAASGRRALALLVALAPAFVSAAASGELAPSLAALLLASGAAGLSARFSNGDARGESIAALSFAAAPLAGGIGMVGGAAGWLALVALAPTAETRRRALAVGGLALLFVSAPIVAARQGAAGAGGPGLDLLALARAAGAREAWGLHWPLGLTALLFGLLRARPRQLRPSLERRAFVAVCALLALTVALGVVGPTIGRGLVELGPAGASHVLVALAPATAIGVGLALVREARP